MSFLTTYNPLWETKADWRNAPALEDDELLLATDFEGGNGENLRRLGAGHYGLDIQPEPGEHRYSGKGYYVCFGVRNKQTEPRTVRFRVQASMDGIWGEQTASMVVRQGGVWRELGPERLHRIADQDEALDIDIDLPAADQDDGVVFVSNYHWWPYNEARAYLAGLADGPARVSEIGRSHGDRPIFAVEFGDPALPCMVHTQTTQPSEMGHLACKAMIDYLCSDVAGARSIRERFHVCFLPLTNPDGGVLGMGVSDGQGRFPTFEGDVAAGHDPQATPEAQLIWGYLERKAPWLYWEWHSNHWKRRPGHMLLRYRPQTMEDEARRAIWLDIDERLLALPDTHHGNWTSRTDGIYQTTFGFQAVIKLNAISCMIKQHDKLALEACRQHAIGCLEVAADCYR